MFATHTARFAAAGAWLSMVAGAAAQPNPYGVSGANWRSNGVMVALGMPGGASSADGCIAYIWDTLQPTNVTNMVRPKRYWEYVGVNSARIQGYDHIADAIHDPAAFGQWVLDHPGQVWIIGNEPNLTGQDGLTPAEYARMFHRYHDFIRAQGRDPTARLAVAGLAGMAYSDWLDGDTAWWDQALAEYAARFGGEMPIDVWNCHGYVTPGSMDPDRAIDEYFRPFRDYTRTVRGGIYAGTEFWVTEFGAFGAGPELNAEYMAQICPRLEALGVNRFFWFLGPWEDPWGDMSLLDSAGMPTVLGATYRSLAMSFPNPIPPPAASMQPFPMAPPLLESRWDDGGAGPWRIMLGDWAVDGGAYRQARVANACFTSSYILHRYDDLRIDIDIRINAAQDPQAWAGITLRGGFVWNDDDTGTYLVYLRGNGELGLWTQADGTVAGVAGAVPDMSAFRRLQVTLIGSQFDIRVDGEPKLAYHDPHVRRSAGLVALRTCRADASFDNLVLRAARASDFDGDFDVDLSDFSLFQLCYGGPNAPPGTHCPVAADLDRDGDVDMADFGRFQACFNGPNRPPACP